MSRTTLRPAISCLFTCSTHADMPSNPLVVSAMTARWISVGVMPTSELPSGAVVVVTGGFVVVTGGFVVGGVVGAVGTMIVEPGLIVGGAVSGPTVTGGAVTGGTVVGADVLDDDEDDVDPSALMFSSPPPELTKATTPPAITATETKITARTPHCRRVMRPSLAYPRATPRSRPGQ